MNRFSVPCMIAAALLLASVAWAQPDLLRPQNLEILGCEAPSKDIAFVSGSQAGNVFYPGEDVSLKIKVAAIVPGPLQITVQEIRMRENKYHSGMSSGGSTVFGGVPAIETTAKGACTFVVDLPASTGNAEREIDVHIPKTGTDRFGTYLVTAAPEGGKPVFLATFIRAHDTGETGSVDSPVFGEGQFITHDSMKPELLKQRMQTLRRLGIRGARIEFGWSEPKPGEYDWERLDLIMNTASECGLKFLVTLSGHAYWTMPFGEPTPAVIAQKPDHSCTPAHYADCEKWIEAFCRRYWNDGNGALWAVEHWNEPWEGISISGWESDTPHYREIMKSIAAGARKVDPRIKTAAACSIMNTEDKFLTGDDRAEWLERIDLFTDHYVMPRNSYGPMVAKHWGKQSTDTETWIAATEMLLPQTMCQFLACGQDRVTPWHPSMTYFSVPGSPLTFQMPNPVALASNTFNAFLNEKPFKKLLFMEHMPWAFQFGEGDDAVVVLFGRLHPLTVDPSAPRDVLRWQWNRNQNPNATMSIDNADGALEFYDVAGNRELKGEKTVTLPVDYLAHYIRAPKGGAALIAERLNATVFKNVSPVEIIVRDFDAPVDKPGTKLRIDLHNLLPQKLSGSFAVRPSVSNDHKIWFENHLLAVELEPGETKRVEFTITESKVSPANAYPFDFEFRSVAGVAIWSETQHVLNARKGTRAIDGNLDDWENVPGVIVSGGERSVSGFTEKMWMPFLDFKEQKPDTSVGELKLAWDDAFLYVAARTNNGAADVKKTRLATRDENQYFRSAADDAVCEKLRPYEKFLNIDRRNKQAVADAEADPAWKEFQALCKSDPEIQAAVDTNAAKVYLAAKRRNPEATFADARHVYKRTPWADYPWAGNTLQLGFDMIEGFAHHELKSDEDRVPTGFHAIPDTDFEFAAYACEDGGTELWYILAPGIRRGHYFPRQPRAGVDQGPVEDGTCVVLRNGTETVYEIAIPWSRFRGFTPKTGADFGFLFRMNAEKGGATLTFGEDKSATKSNGLSLHPYWSVKPSCSIRWTLAE